MSVSRNVRVGLRIAASLVLLIVLAVTLEPSRLADTLLAVDARAWLVAVLLYAASQLVSSYRWGGLARAVGLDCDDRQLASHYFAGAFVNLCLPSSLGGDALRALRLAPRGNSDARFRAACSVAVDRVVGLSALLVLGIVGLVVRGAAWGVIALVLAALAGMVLHLFAVRFARAAAVGVTRWVGAETRVWPSVRGLIDSLAPYHERHGVLSRAVGWSWLVQLLNIAAVVWLGRALHLNIPLETYFVAVPAVAVLAVLPVSISGIGAREIGLALLLPTTPEESVTLGLAWFSIVLTTGLFGALPFLLHDSETSRAVAPARDRAHVPHSRPARMPLR